MPNYFRTFVRWTFVVDVQSSAECFLFRPEIPGRPYRALYFCNLPVLQKGLPRPWTGAVVHTARLHGVSQFLNCFHFFCLNFNSSFGQYMSEEVDAPLEQATLLYVFFQIRCSKSSENFMKTIQMTVKITAEDDNVVEVYETRFICQSTKH